MLQDLSDIEALHDRQEHPEHDREHVKCDLGLEYKRAQSVINVHQIGISTNAN